MRSQPSPQKKSFSSHSTTPRQKLVLKNTSLPRESTNFLRKEKTRQPWLSSAILPFTTRKQTRFFDNQPTLSRKRKYIPDKRSQTSRTVTCLTVEQRAPASSVAGQRAHAALRAALVEEGAVLTGPAATATTPATTTLRRSAAATDPMRGAWRRRRLH